MTRYQPSREPLPSVLQRKGTDEFVPPAYSPAELAAVHQVAEQSPDRARRVKASTRAYARSRLGTAAALRAINEQRGGDFYHVPAEAALDQAAADAALGGNQTIIDVQTHFVANRSLLTPFQQQILTSYRNLMPAGFQGMDGMTGFPLAEYLRCLFLESETAVAVLSSPPGVHEDRPLTNGEMAGGRLLVERFGGSGRMLNQTVVHPNVPSEIDRMAHWRDLYGTAAWKVYTTGMMGAPGTGWMLDDEATGIPFLRRVRESGVLIMSVHKGLSGNSPTGSPREIGTVAKLFPDISFVVYHSGYEHPEASPEALAANPIDPVSGQVIDPEAINGQEGPYAEEFAHIGTNRLVKSLKDAGVPPGSNVYAELGSTYFSLIRRPAEAAHVLGKLLLAVGEDNVLWGTDSIWYGPTRPVVDAFRAFQIPVEYQQRYGYPELTPRIKEKILGLNTARVYGIDVEQARKRLQNDDLAWAKAAIEEYKQHGLPIVQ